MTWEEVHKDMDAYQAALDVQTSSGVDRRVAEGRARRAGVRAYLKAHPDEEAAHHAPPTRRVSEARIGPSLTRRVGVPPVRLRRRAPSPHPAGGAGGRSP